MFINPVKNSLIIRYIYLLINSLLNFNTITFDVSARLRTNIDIIVYQARKILEKKTINISCSNIKKLSIFFRKKRIWVKTKKKNTTSKS